METIRCPRSSSSQTTGAEFAELKQLTTLLPMGFGDDMLRFNGIGERITTAMMAAGRAYTEASLLDYQQRHTRKPEPPRPRRAMHASLCCRRAKARKPRATRNGERRTALPDANRPPVTVGRPAIANHQTLVREWLRWRPSDGTACSATSSGGDPVATRPVRCTMKNGKHKPGTFDVVPRALARDRRMSDLDVRAVLYIASYGDRAFPSYATIARDLGIHRATAIEGSSVRWLAATSSVRRDGTPKATDFKRLSPRLRSGVVVRGDHPSRASTTTVVVPARPCRKQPNETVALTRPARPRCAGWPRRNTARAKVRNQYWCRARASSLGQLAPRTTAAVKASAAADGGALEAGQDHEPPAARPPPVRGCRFPEDADDRRDAA